MLLRNGCLKYINQYRFYSMKLFRYLFRLLSYCPMSGKMRWHFVKYLGVHFPKHKNVSIFIGDRVTFDGVFPEEIEIGNHVHITTGCIILTHYLDTSNPGISWVKGHVRIEDDVFIGCNTVITKAVTIGKGSIIGAASVVTRDIPPYEIWGGNPAKFIKKRV